MTVIVFRGMEVYPEKWTVPRIMRVAPDVMCMMWCAPSIFSGNTSIQRKIITVIFYHFILNAINMHLNEFDVNVAIGIDNDVLPVRWMEEYPFRFYQSKSVFHAETKIIVKCYHGRSLNVCFWIRYLPQLSLLLVVKTCKNSLKLAKWHIGMIFYSYTYNLIGMIIQKVNIPTIDLVQLHDKFYYLLWNFLCQTEMFYSGSVLPIPCNT